jgi:hypothetical protein
MVRIFRVYDDSLPVNRRAIEQVQEILRSRFSGVHEEDILKIPDQLTNPWSTDSLFVAEGRGGQRPSGIVPCSHPDRPFVGNEALPPFRDFSIEDRRGPFWPPAGRLIGAPPKGSGYITTALFHSHRKPKSGFFRSR